MADKLASFNRLFDISYANRYLFEVKNDVYFIVVVVSRNMESLGLLLLIDFYSLLHFHSVFVDC